MKFTAIAFAALTFLTSEAGARESTLLRASKNEDKANPASGGNPQADALQCYEKCSHKALDKFSISVKSMDVEEEREVRLGKNELSKAEEEIQEDLDGCTSECASEAQEAAASSGRKFNETAAENAFVCYGVCNAEAAEEYVDEAKKDVKKELKDFGNGKVKDEGDCKKACKCEEDEDSDCDEKKCQNECEDEVEDAYEDAEKDAAKKAEKSLDKCAEGCTEAALPFLFVKTGRTSTLLRASKVAARVGSGTGGTGDDSDTLDGCFASCGDAAIKDYSIPSSGWTAASEDGVSLRKSGDTDKQEAELTADITACASTCVASAEAAATRSGLVWNETVAEEATACVGQCSSLAAAAYYKEVDSEISDDMKEWGSIDEKDDCEKECESSTVVDCEKECEDDWDKAVDDAEKEGTKEAQKVFDSCLVTCEPASKMFAALEIA